MERVRLSAAYLADRDPKYADRYREMVMTTDDGQLSDKYWGSALGWVSVALKRFGGEPLNNDAGIALLNVSANSLAANSDVIKNAVASAIENKVLSEWLYTVGSQHADKYREKAQGYVEEAIDLCNRRIRPARLAR